MKNVLISRTDRIGDLVLSLPVLESLKSACPDWRVGYLVNEYTAPLLKNHPLVDYVIKTKVRGDNRGGIKNLTEFKRLLKEIKSLPVDIAVVLHSKPSIAYLFYRCHVKERIGIDGRYYSFLYTKRVKIPSTPIHTIDRNLLFLVPLGLKHRATKPRLYLKEDEIREGEKLWSYFQKPRIVLHLSSKTARTWPEEYFCLLADSLIKDGFTVALTGKYKKCRVEGCLDFDEKLDLRRLMALIKKANLVIAGSTGVLHVASALGTPTFALFDPSLKDHVTKWRPVGESHKIYLPRKKLEEITPKKLKEDIIHFFSKSG